ncbi:MAG: DUF1294 domain-containing protein [Myxococcota bacterium]
MPEPDLILVALGVLVLWWIGDATGSVLRSRRPAKHKLGWVVALWLLPPFGLVAFLIADRKRGRRWGLGVTVSLTLTTLVAVSLLAATRPWWQGHDHLAWVAAWGVAAFMLYAIDKWAAKAGSNEQGRSKRARVDERALHLVALLGGFVGAWLGRHGLRHKTRKPLFLAVLVVATLLHGSKLLRLW